LRYPAAMYPVFAQLAKGACLACEMNCCSEIA